MRVVIFCHSVLSDWNHGNAHFLRGVISELTRTGHDVIAYEPEDAWSVQNLVRDHGPAALGLVYEAYPELAVRRYRPSAFDLDAALDGADLVIVHEWSDPALVADIGRRRASGGRFRVLFHDTHHRTVTDPGAIARLDLSAYDGVLAFGAAVADIYARHGWAGRAWVWHEAADPRVFRPHPELARTEDLVWVGNWGDDERTQELRAFLLEPAHDLGIAPDVYGVRYPADATRELAARGARYHGWLPNLRVPEVFARHRVTVHVPRRPYVEALPGIPTIRVFEALACGIPLVSGPWLDREGLFEPGTDFLLARDRDEMRRHLRELLAEPAAREAIAARGRQTVLARHTCAHRVEELSAIARSLGLHMFAWSSAPPSVPQVSV